MHGPLASLTSRLGAVHLLSISTRVGRPLNARSKRRAVCATAGGTRPVLQTQTAPTVLPGERASCGGGALPSSDVPGLRSQLHVLLDMEELVAALG